MLYYQNTNWYKNCLHKATIASSVTGLIQGRSAAAYNNYIEFETFLVCFHFCCKKKLNGTKAFAEFRENQKSCEKLKLN